MLFSVEQAFVGRDEKRAPLKMPAWEATMSVEISISCVVKGYHHYPFKVKEGEVFSISKKRREHGNTFKESTMSDILVFNKSQ